MNLSVYISKRLNKNIFAGKGISSKILKLTIISTAMSVAIMIASVAIVTGFRKVIVDKLVGFGSHISVKNYDSNYSFETKPINVDNSFFKYVKSNPNVKSIQVYASKPGIVKTSDVLHGVVLKGVGSDYDWNFINSSLVQGSRINFPADRASNEIIVSKKIANTLSIKLNDELTIYFIQDPPRARIFKVCGIYETYFEPYDNVFVIVDIRHIRKLNKWADNQVSGYEISLNNLNKIDEVKEQIYNNTPNVLADGSVLRVNTIKEEYSSIFDWLALIDVNVWVILFILLVISILNVSAAVLVLVLENIKTIGILKALGADNGLVRKIFFNQALFLLIRGVVIGNLLGIGLCILENHVHLIKLNAASYFVESVPFYFDWFLIGLLNIAIILIIGISLLIPTIIISRISPVKTIKFD